MSKQGRAFSDTSLKRSMEKAQALVARLRGRGWILLLKGVGQLGMIPRVHSSDLGRLDPELGQILDHGTWEESVSCNLARSQRGSLQQRERIALVAELCAQRHLGDLIEIGAHLGKTTTKLAEVAQRYHRRVIVVDPWEPGTQNSQGWEYDAFLQNIEPYADTVDVVRASSMEKDTISLVRSRALCFAFVDGLHTYKACFSDIRTVSHTTGIIVVDDILCRDYLMFAFRRGAGLTGRVALHHPLCREGYLLPSLGDASHPLQP